MNVGINDCTLLLDLHIAILQKVHPLDLLSCLETCKTWHEIILNPDNLYAGNGRFKMLERIKYNHFASLMEVKPNLFEIPQYIFDILGGVKKVAELPTFIKFGPIRALNWENWPISCCVQKVNSTWDKFIVIHLIDASETKKCCVLDFEESLMWDYSDPDIAEELNKKYLSSESIRSIINGNPITINEKEFKLLK